jgi:L-rhamnose mutarotase
VYVEQVNMLKLIEQKKEEYKAKHETILKLRG